MTIQKIDDLTKLPVKDAILSYLESLHFGAGSADGGETSGNRLYTVALMDFDNFKYLNENFGHTFCDDMLREIAGIIAGETENYGKAGRYGGDEFILVFVEKTFEETFVILENIRRMIKNKSFSSGGPDNKAEAKTTCSIGMASFPNDGKDFMEVIRSADEALYRAKIEGRDRICIAIDEKKVAKTIYFTKRQVERIAELSARLGKTESALYREAADHIINYYEQQVEQKDLEDRIKILFGSKISKMVNLNLIQAVDEARGRLFRETGLDFPGVSLQVDPTLKEDELAFIVNGREFSRHILDTDDAGLYPKVVRLFLDNVGKALMES